MFYVFLRDKMTLYVVEILLTKDLKFCLSYYLIQSELHSFSLCYCTRLYSSTIMKMRFKRLFLANQIVYIFRSNDNCFYSVPGMSPDLFNCIFHIY